MAELQVDTAMPRAAIDHPFSCLKRGFVRIFTFSVKLCNSICDLCLYRVHSIVEECSTVFCSEPVSPPRVRALSMDALLYMSPPPPPPPGGSSEKHPSLMSVVLLIDVQLCAY